MEIKLTFGAIFSANTPESSFVSYKLSTMKTGRLNSILAYLRDNPQSSSKAIFDALPDLGGYATVKRELAKAVAEGTVVVTGLRKAARYSVAPGFGLLQSIDLESYFSKEIDERTIRESYNFELIDTLAKASLFTPSETAELGSLQNTFAANLSKLSAAEYRKEMERLGVDLSWKSSQIEGNTYSLLETERLLLEKETIYAEDIERILGPSAQSAKRAAGTKPEEGAGGKAAADELTEA